MEYKLIFIRDPGGFWQCDNMLKPANRQLSQVQNQRILVWHDVTDLQCWQIAFILVNIWTIKHWAAIIICSSFLQIFAAQPLDGVRFKASLHKTVEPYRRELEWAVFLANVDRSKGTTEFGTSGIFTTLDMCFCTFTPEGARSYKQLKYEAVCLSSV